jgi:hypothetical protein
VDGGRLLLQGTLEQTKEDKTQRTKIQCNEKKPLQQTLLFCHFHLICTCGPLPPERSHGCALFGQCWPEVRHSRRPGTCFEPPPLPNAPTPPHPVPPGVVIMIHQKLWIMHTLDCQH